MKITVPRNTWFFTPLLFEPENIGPCPKCGSSLSTPWQKAMFADGDGYTRRVSGGYGISCPIHDCGYVTGIHDELEDAVLEWNGIQKGGAG